jgi:hypothetical protein
MPSFARLLATASVAVFLMLLQACGGGGGGGVAAVGTTEILVLPPGSTVNGVSTTTPGTSTVAVNGLATYEFVPNHGTTGALDYANTTRKPIRAATVQAMAADKLTVLASKTTSDQGTYAFTLPINTAYSVRVRAELLNTAGPATWNVAVKDNTQGDALWLIDGGNANTGVTDSVRDINAPSGWNGTSYTATSRVAGVFAILDTVYTSIKLIRSAQPSAKLPILSIFWSPANRPITGPPNIAIGEVGNAYFTTTTSGNRVIYLLGKEDVDTDEYDATTIAHEYGHYLQSAFSTNHSVGGEHGVGDKLDMTLAFSEGWGYAWSAMSRNNPVSIDTYGFRQGGAYKFDVSLSPTINKGWYREDSVQYILFKLYQDQGFTPIWNAMTGPMNTTQSALGSIFSFAAAVRDANNTTVTASLNALLGSQSIFVGTGADQWGFGETNSGATTGTLPIYTSMSLSTTVSACFDSVNVANSGYPDDNKLGATKYFRVTVLTPGSRTITARFADGRDIDFAVYQNRIFKTGAFTDSASQPLGNSLRTTETAIDTFAAGEIVIRISDFVTTALPVGTPCATLNIL